MSKRVLRFIGLVATVVVLVGAGLVLRNRAVQAAGANAPAAQGTTD